MTDTKALEDDRELLKAFREGRPAALRAVYELYCRDLEKFLRFGFGFASGGRRCRYHGTHSTFDLEDKLHDVFARAFKEQARLGYNGLTPYRAYLRTIARNLIIDDFRKKEHALVDYSFEELPEPAAATGASYDFVAKPSVDPEERAQQTQLQGLVERFAQDLPARERRVYELRFEQHLEHSDITARTGLSPSRVKTSEERIRVRFFRFMRTNGYFAEYQQNKGGWLSSLKAL